MTSADDVSQDADGSQPPRRLDVPGLSGIFDDASMYQQIIKDSPDYIRAGVLSPDFATEAAQYGPDFIPSMSFPEKRPSLSGFVQLVGKDLDPAERVVSSRLAQLTVGNWMPGGDGMLSDEPDSDELDETDSTDTSSSTHDSSTAEAVRSPVDAVWPTSPSRNRSPTRMSTVDEKMEPDEIVSLLNEEFGALGEPGEETLLLEADGALIQDVVIIGVIHVTTHRLTFHASLNSAQPSASTEILKSGAVMIHRTGLHRKRRVWLELSRDMLSSYASSRDEDRIRPIRSLLLSSIKEIVPMDTKRPKHARVIFNGLADIADTDVEFDTEESAREWRRELNGAIYLNRRSRNSALRSRSRSISRNSSIPSTPSSETAVSADEDDTIRIHIPLHRIEHAETKTCFSFASMLSIAIDTLSARPEDLLSLGPDIEGSPINAPRSWSPRRYGLKSRDSSPEPGPASIEHAPARQVLQLSIMQYSPVWEKFNEHVDIAKARVSDDATYEERWQGSRVYIGLEPAWFDEEETAEVEGQEEPSPVQEKVKTSVGIGYFCRKSREQEAKRQYERLKRDTAKALAMEQTNEFWVSKASVHRLLACYTGYIALSADSVGFWSKALTASHDVKYRLPLSLIKDATPYQTHRILGDYGVALTVQGYPDMRFIFRSEATRDDMLTRISLNLARDRERRTLYTSPATTPISVVPTTAASSPGSRSGVQTPIQVPQRGITVDSAVTSSAASSTSRLSRGLLRGVTLPPIPYALKTFLPKAINIPDSELLTRLKVPPMHFVCLTIGSRGDVQPYIALGLGLMKEGHRVTIVTHEEYKEWVVGFGIGHRTAGGDPGALMKLSVENKMFSPQFFKESLGHFRTWLDELLVDAWECCKDADVLLESPSAMAGVHIAEALHIPYFRTFTMPWSKTRDFPHAFLSPPVESPTFNATSYVLFDNVMWTATSGQINRWRKHTLHIAATDMGHLAQSKIPFIYNFSPAVVPKPLDWGDATTISGYWFLDNPDPDWTPPETLIAWMDKARKDEKPIVYIGFGSIVVPNPTQVTKNIIQAVQKSGVRAIISKGWSARMAKDTEEEVVFPEECYSLSKVPHDWLFTKIDAALHHGGAGTTGASLRAGIPTLIRPWFGDQYFWASRVQRLGAGLRVSSLRVNEVADALTKATTDRIMKEKAASVGERIRREDGVQTAIQAIYTYLPRAGRDRTTIT
ncbi:UDP-Glycosyltransferase/glycogen phosphorylase [Dentipellis sp. KUC8613]|nr:UDP-Glycosyltransferase/glycogen phosphorylase [Dentipellis sp. KUC8613]